MSSTEVVVDTIDGVEVTVDTKIGAFHATVNGRTFEHRVLNTLRKEVQAWLRATANKREVLDLDRPNPDTSYGAPDIGKPTRFTAIAYTAKPRPTVQQGDGRTWEVDDRGRKIVAHDEATEQQAREWRATYEAILQRHKEELRALAVEYLTWLDTLPPFTGEGLRDTLYPTREF